MAKTQTNNGFLPTIKEDALEYLTVEDVRHQNSPVSPVGGQHLEVEVKSISGAAQRRQQLKAVKGLGAGAGRPTLPARSQSQQSGSQSESWREPKIHFESCPVLQYQREKILDLGCRERAILWRKLFEKVRSATQLRRDKREERAASATHRARPRPDKHVSGARDFSIVDFAGSVTVVSIDSIVASARVDSDLQAYLDTAGVVVPSTVERILRSRGILCKQRVEQQVATALASLGGYGCNLEIGKKGHRFVFPAIISERFPLELVLEALPMEIICSIQYCAAFHRRSHIAEVNWEQPLKSTAMLFRVRDRQRSRDLLEMAEARRADDEWVRDLVSDGDVESNPGPSKPEDFVPTPSILGLVPSGKDDLHAMTELFQYLGINKLLEASSVSAWAGPGRPSSEVAVWVPEKGKIDRAYQLHDLAYSVKPTDVGRGDEWRAAADRRLAVRLSDNAYDPASTIFDRLARGYMQTVGSEGAKDVETDLDGLEENFSKDKAPGDAKVTNLPSLPPRKSRKKWSALMHALNGNIFADDGYMEVLARSANRRMHALNGNMSVHRVVDMDDFMVGVREVKAWGDRWADAAPATPDGATPALLQTTLNDFVKLFDIMRPGTNGLASSSGGVMCSSPILQTMHLEPICPLGYAGVREALPCNWFGGSPAVGARFGPANLVLNPSNVGHTSYQDLGNPGMATFIESTEEGIRPLIRTVGASDATAAWLNGTINGGLDRAAVGTGGNKWAIMQALGASSVTAIKGGSEAWLAFNLINGTLFAGDVSDGVFGRFSNAGFGVHAQSKSDMHPGVSFVPAPEESQQNGTIEASIGYLGNLHTQTPNMIINVMACTAVEAMQLACGGLGANPALGPIVQFFQEVQTVVFADMAGSVSIDAFLLELCSQQSNSMAFGRVGGALANNQQKVPNPTPNPVEVPFLCSNLSSVTFRSDSVPFIEAGMPGRGEVRNVLLIIPATNAADNGYFSVAPPGGTGMITAAQWPMLYIAGVLIPYDCYAQNPGFTGAVNLAPVVEVAVRAKRPRDWYSMLQYSIANGRISKEDLQEAENLVDVLLLRRNTVAAIVDSGTATPANTDYGSIAMSYEINGNVFNYNMSVNNLLIRPSFASSANAAGNYNDFLCLGSQGWRAGAMANQEGFLFPVGFVADDVGDSRVWEAWSQVMESHIWPRPNSGTTRTSCLKFPNRLSVTARIMIGCGFAKLARGGVADLSKKDYWQYGWKRVVKAHVAHFIAEADKRAGLHGAEAFYSGMKVSAAHVQVAIAAAAYKTYFDFLRRETGVRFLRESDVPRMNVPGQGTIDWLLGQYSVQDENVACYYGNQDLWFLGGAGLPDWAALGKERPSSSLYELWESGLDRAVFDAVFHVPLIKESVKMHNITWGVPAAGGVVNVAVRTVTNDSATCLKLAYSLKSESGRVAAAQLKYLGRRGTGTWLVPRFAFTTFPKYSLSLIFPHFKGLSCGWNRGQFSYYGAGQYQYGAGLRDPAGGAAPLIPNLLFFRDLEAPITDSSALYVLRLPSAMSVDGLDRFYAFYAPWVANVVGGTQMVTDIPTSSDNLQAAPVVDVGGSGAGVEILQEMLDAIAIRESKPDLADGPAAGQAE